MAAGDSTDAIRRRIRRGGRSAGVSASSEGGYSRVEEDDDDLQDEPEADLNERVRQIAQTAGAPIRRSAQPTTDGTTGAGDFTPANRLAEVAALSPEYAREYRLRLVHRMMMRNVPLDEIARELDVSLSTIHRDRQTLKQLLCRAAEGLDINELIGDSMGFYREVQGMGLRAASNSKAPLNHRIAAMRTALSSKNDEHRFLQTAGVYDVLRYKPNTAGKGDDIRKLVDITSALLDGDEGALKNDDQETASDLDLIHQEVQIV